MNNSVLQPQQNEAEAFEENPLRPLTLSEFIGQPDMRSNLAT